MATGPVIVTVNDSDKPTVTPLVRRLADLGFRILATRGTRNHLRQLGIPCEQVRKVGEGRPNIVDRIVSGHVGLLINHPARQEIAVRRLLHAARGDRLRGALPDDHVRHKRGGWTP